MKNQDVRMLIFEKNLKHYQLAELIGISSGTLSVWLRSELTLIRRKRILLAINEFENEKKKDEIKTADHRRING